MRASSITDQLFIKAKRIKTLEEKKVAKILESEIGEYIAIVNYAIIGMIQLEWGESPNLIISSTLIEEV